MLHLLALANRRVGFEEIKKVVRPVPAVEEHLEVPGLVVDARSDDVDVGLGDAPETRVVLGPAGIDVALEEPRKQMMAALNPVAEADGPDRGVIERRPGVHGHRVRVVEEHAIRAGVAFDLVDEFEDHRHGALPVHQPAGADRVADALVDAYLSGISTSYGTLKAADTQRGVDHEVGTSGGRLRFSCRGGRRVASERRWPQSLAGAACDHVGVRRLLVLERELGRP